MASMRSWYSWLWLVSVKRPTRWLLFTPNSSSSGSTKVWNMSSTRPLQSGPVTMLRTSSLTKVMNTMERLPSRAVTALISATTTRAFSGVSIKGRRTCRGLDGNCASIELPNVSAVMPVPSETKNTVRSVI